MELFEVLCKLVKSANLTCEECFSLAEIFSYSPYQFRDFAQHVTYGSSWFSAIISYHERVNREIFVNMPLSNISEKMPKTAFFRYLIFLEKSF